MKTSTSFLFCFAIITSIVISFGCAKEDDDVAAPSNTNPNGNNGQGNGVGTGSGNGNSINYLDVSTTSVSFDKNSGSRQILISSNIEWSVSTTGSWLDVSSRNGKDERDLIIYADENNTSSSRSGSLTISGNGLSETVNVRQDANNSRGAVTFYKDANNYNTIHLYFNNDFVGYLGPNSRYSGSPGCFANGCITMDDLKYKSYSWRAEVYNAAGDKVVKSDNGNVTIDSSCETIKVEPSW